MSDSTTPDPASLSPSDAPPQKRRRFPRLRKFIIRSAIVFGIVLILLAVRAIIDEKPQPNDDLEPKSLAEVADKDNAFLVILRAISAYVPPKSHDTQLIASYLNRDEDYDDAVSAGVDDAAVQSFSRDNHEALQLLLEASTLPRYRESFLIAQPDADDTYAPAEFSEYSKKLRRLALLARIEGWQSARLGDYARVEEVVRCLLNVGRLSLMNLEHSINWLPNNFCQQVAHSILRDLAQQPLPDLDGLKRMARELPSLGSSSAELASVFRCEHSQALRRLQREWPARIPFFYKPEQTRNLLGTRCRLGIQRLDENGSDWTTWGNPGLLGGLEYLAGGNSNGWEYVGAFCFVLDTYLISIQVTKADRSATQLLLALRAFELERGAMPSSLDELVPEYLRELPLDPQGDGEGFHYFPDERRVASVMHDDPDDESKFSLDPPKDR